MYRYNPIERTHYQISYNTLWVGAIITFDSNPRKGSHHYEVIDISYIEKYVIIKSLPDGYQKRLYRDDYLVQEKKEHMQTSKLTVVIRKQIPIHYVEDLPCYVIEKKIHQIENPPENLDKYKLYLVKRDNGSGQIELVMEE